MLYLCTTLKLYIWFSDVDNDVVLALTVVEDGRVLKLHTE